MTPASHIPLTQGLVALVDPSDFDWLNQWKWSSDTRNAGYARRGFTVGGVRRLVLMHRLITSAPDGVCVDHINGNGLDNRRVNLRLCSAVENKWNVGVRIDNRAGIKGVRLCKGRWMARIQHNNRPVYLGSFDTANEAGVAYDVAARLYHGEFARLNFADGAA